MQCTSSNPNPYKSLKHAVFGPLYAGGVSNSFCHLTVSNDLPKKTENLLDRGLRGCHSHLIGLVLWHKSVKWAHTLGRVETTYKSRWGSGCSSRFSDVLAHREVPVGASS